MLGGGGRLRAIVVDVEDASVVILAAMLAAIYGPLLLKLGEAQLQACKVATIDDETRVGQLADKQGAVSRAVLGLLDSPRDAAILFQDVATLDLGRVAVKQDLITNLVRALDDLQPPKGRFCARLGMTHIHRQAKDHRPVRCRVKRLELTGDVPATAAGPCRRLAVCHFVLAVPASLLIRLALFTSRHLL